MKYDVIIPCLNEQSTISHIVERFIWHRLIQDVHVMVDDATIDNTYHKARQFGACAHRIAGVKGKGQLVASVLPFIQTDRVILCDGDYTNLNAHAIDLVCAATSPPNTMRIVSPRSPTRQEWKQNGIPEVPYKPSMWVMTSGFRSLPASLLKKTRQQLHGYLLEIQLNNAARTLGYPIETVIEPSLRAPLRFTPRRLQAMEEDRQWAIENGVFDA